MSEFVSESWFNGRYSAELLIEFDGVETVTLEHWIFMFVLLIIRIRILCNDGIVGTVSLELKILQVGFCIVAFARAVVWSYFSTRPHFLWIMKLLSFYVILMYRCLKILRVLNRLWWTEEKVRKMNPIGVLSVGGRRGVLLTKMREQIWGREEEESDRAYDQGQRQTLPHQW